MRTFILSFTGLLFFAVAVAQSQPATMQYTVSMEKAAEHLFHVELFTVSTNHTPAFKMCAWTPGYYQLIDFAGAVQNFVATDTNGTVLQWQKDDSQTWRVNTGGAPARIAYDVKAVVPFVGNVYLDEERGYITPGGLFMYLDSELRHPVSVSMHPYRKWTGTVATGLDTIPGMYHTFKADNFDVLYDSPFLMGKLESLPPFTVNNKPHDFIGYQLPAFDRQDFMNDLKKIVIAGSAIIGEIPYSHYTFLSIGAGGGGIEHLNSTSLSFNSREGFMEPASKKRLYNFIAHEYFHHYNVKRIRPIELGPFDYAKENHTNMLWVSEGFTVYYEYLITLRAGLSNAGDLLGFLSDNMKNYENQPGHLYQSATEASFNTWGDGPNGRVNDAFNKTISYYDKGPVLGLMLDFAIRHSTKNKRTLDDVMRLLYYKYYKQLNRGFTEAEFRKECEKMAGTTLPDIFRYASTVDPPDYPRYFAYGGLAVDTAIKAVEGAWSGINARLRNDTMRIVSVDYQSPAWEQKLAARMRIIAINGQPATMESFNSVRTGHAAGEEVIYKVEKEGVVSDVIVKLGTKHEKSFTITALPHPDALQETIYHGWLGK